MSVLEGIIPQVEKWQAILAQRRVLEQAAKQLKKQEEEFIAGILMSMDAAKVESVNVRDVGTVYKTVNKKIRLSDIEKLCDNQLRMFIEAAAENRPLSDALLFQQRPLQTELLKLVGKDSNFDYGVNLQEEMSLHLRK